MRNPDTLLKFYDKINYSIGIMAAIQQNEFIFLLLGLKKWKLIIAMPMRSFSVSPKLHALI